MANGDDNIWPRACKRVKKPDLTRRCRSVGAFQDPLASRALALACELICFVALQDNATAQRRQEPPSKTSGVLEIQSGKSRAFVLDSHASPTIHFSFAMPKRALVTFTVAPTKGTRVADGPAYPFADNLANTFKVSITEKAKGTISRVQIDLSSNPYDLLFLLPRGDYRLTVSLAKNAREEYWTEHIALQLVVSNLFPTDFNPALLTFVQALPSLSVDPELIDLIDYRSAPAAQLAARDREVAVSLLPALCQGFALQTRMSDPSSILTRSELESKNPRLSQIWLAYSDLFNEEKARVGRLPYYRPPPWIVENGVPQIIVRMPHDPLRQHDSLRRIDWARALEQLASTINVHPTDLAVLFLDGCHSTVITYVSPTLVSIDYGFRCAMVADRGEPFEGEVDLSVAVPAFLKIFLPSEARVQFDRSTSWNTEVVVRGLRGHVVPGEKAWERIELIFNIEKRSERPRAVAVQTVVDVKSAHTIGAYPPDTQFTDSLGRGEMQAYARQIVFKFDAFLRERKLYAPAPAGNGK